MNTESLILSTKTEEIILIGSTLTNQMNTKLFDYFLTHIQYINPEPISEQLYVQKKN